MKLIPQDHLYGAHNQEKKGNDMKKFIISLLLAIIFPSLVFASAYGNYDVKKVLSLKKDTAGKNIVSVDRDYLEHILADLMNHAGNYPAKFDSAADKERAVKNVMLLSNVLDILNKSKKAEPSILLHTGILNSIGHNLDIQNSTERANAAFQRLLESSPNDPQGNYHYGVFLGNSGRAKESIPYLEKALRLNVKNAAYSLGMAYIATGDKERGIEYLKQYSTNHPDDKSIQPLINAVRSGKYRVKHAVEQGRSSSSFEKDKKTSEVFQVDQPEGYQVSLRVDRTDMLMIEMIPTGETRKDFSESLTQVHIKSKSKYTTIDFYKGMTSKILDAACNNGEMHQISKETDNHYPCMILFSECPAPKKTGKPFYKLSKTIEGNEGLYLLEKEWKNKPGKHDMEKWEKIFRASTLCDLERPGHPCPKNLKRQTGETKSNESSF